MNLQIEFSSDVHSSYISADKSKISQVIRNLLSNGLKFTKSGGNVKVSVQLESRRRQSIQDIVMHRSFRQPRTHATDEAPSPSSRRKRVLVISVKDSGAGISPVSDIYICYVATLW